MTTTSIGGPGHPGADEPAADGGTDIDVLDRGPDDDAQDADEPSLQDRLSPPMPADGIWGWVWPLAVTVLAGVLRFRHLGNPPQIVFDETYYVKDAYSVLKYGYERKVVDVPDGGIPIDTQILDGRTDIFGTDPSYVVHPPVGKWMIALGEQLFGLTPLGWRFAVALFGTLTVLVLARLARRMFRSTLLGTIAGLLLALDSLSIVMSRTALLDGLLAFWLVCAVACLLVDRDRGRALLADRVTALREAGARVPPGGPGLGVRWWRIAAGVCFGLAIGTKWSALFVLALCGLMVLLWDINARRVAGIARPYSAGIVYDGIPAFFSTVCVGAVTYLASWTGWFVADNSMYRTWGAENPATGAASFVPDALRSLWHYHVEVYGFHTGLTSEHPYAAHPIRWLFQGRPTQFEFASVDATTTDLPHGVTGTAEQLCGAERCARDIVAVGTPALWWAACLALFVLVVLWIGRRDWRAGAILGLVAATYLPWFNYGQRPIFFFYSVAIIPFLVLGVTLVIGYALGPPDAPRQRRSRAAIFIGAYLVLVLINTGYLYPVLTGEWIPYDDYSARMWFRTWI